LHIVQLCDGDADRNPHATMPKSTLKETCNGEEESQEGSEEESQSQEEIACEHQRGLGNPQLPFLLPFPPAADSPSRRDDQAPRKPVT
jgi:hypothetical protein